MAIWVDGKDYEIDPRVNLLQGLLQLGFNLPYFCWHPALGSVGACRQCAVKQFKDENDTRGRLVMACMTPATAGTRVSIADPEARDFRKEVIEWLMLNHPHDCPVCDEGGECHLQDMTVMAGHAYRRTRFPKRTYRNQDLGPFLNHEMNRCIQCYRCVRFYRDYAGGRDLDVFGAHDHVYFGRHEDGVLENEFSGNLAEVCPTGVFTDKTLGRHYTRKWDLQMSPSICVHCGLGCNTSPGERYRMLRRIVNRYNGEVNGYFLCDRGRFGYEFVNHPRRLQVPRLRSDGGRRAMAREDALREAAAALRGCDRLVGIGSPRASLEANFALRALVGRGGFFPGLPARDLALARLTLEILRAGPVPVASLREAELADAVLVLGEDVTNTAPRLALSLRQSVRQQPMALADALKIDRWHDAAVRDVVQSRRGPLYIAASGATRLDEISTGTFRATTADIARLGFAVAHAVDGRAPAADSLDREDVQSLVREIASALLAAERPLVVAGPGAGSEAVLRAAANVAWALHGQGRQARILLTTPEPNTLGAALLGGGSLEEAIAAVEGGGKVGVVVLENDLFRRVPRAAVERLFSSAAWVVALDHIDHRITQMASLALPAASFAEGDGTFVSNEGRAQRFFQVFVPRGGEIQESWRWLRDLLDALGLGERGGWKDLDAVIAALCKAEPALAGVALAAPPASTRFAGQRVPRQPPRYSGRTAMQANRTVHEPMAPPDPDSALAFSMEGYGAQPPPALTPYFWAPGWNSIQAVNKFQEEIAGSLRGGDPGVRLFEPAEGEGRFFPATVDAPGGQGEWLVVPGHHIFGSEELSSLAPGIAERAPQPYVALCPEDATRLGVEEGRAVEVSVAGEVLRLPARMAPELPRGVVQVPVGLPGLPALELPARGALKGRA